MTDPKPVLCKKSPDYPLRQTVIIEAVEAISPLIKDPKLAKNKKGITIKIGSTRNRESKNITSKVHHGNKCRNKSC